MDVSNFTTGKYCHQIQGSTPDTDLFDVTLQEVLNAEDGEVKNAENRE